MCYRLRCFASFYSILWVVVVAVTNNLHVKFISRFLCVVTDVSSSSVVSDTTLYQWQKPWSKAKHSGDNGG